MAMDGDLASENEIDGVHPDEEASDFSLQEAVSLDGESLRELFGAGEVLARVELDLAYSSEKLINLDILLMQVATRENDYETSAMESDEISDDSFEKWLEFDFLSGILDSEVRVLEKFMVSLQPEIMDVREKVLSCEHLREGFGEMERKLHDSEESLEQSQNQVAEIRMQCNNFQKTLLAFGGQENGNNSKDADVSEIDQFSNKNAKIKMQTTEQQRHILRMLEKSLARELDLEKKLFDSRNSEEESNLKLHSAEQEMFCMDEEVEDVLWRLFEAENAAEILMGISKEIIGRLQINQFNLNSSIQREGEMTSKLGISSASLDKSVETQIETLEANLVSPELSEMKVVIKDLEAHLLEAETKAETAEAKCSLLEEGNLVLNEELALLKGSENVIEKVNLLEKQLRESDMHLQHAKVSVEASQEQQNMLYSAITDMENLINDLKSKVLRAETRAEKSEAKCASLSETNSELNEEVSFLRDKMECLETSLHQADEEKTVTANEINKRAKVITDMVMQLARERERLHKQISSLTNENKILVSKFRKDCKGNKDDEDNLATDINKQEPKEAVTESAANFQVSQTERDTPEGEAAAEQTTTLEEDTAVAESNPEPVRKREAGKLNWTFLFSVVVLLISIAVFLFQLERFKF